MKSSSKIGFLKDNYLLTINNFEIQTLISKSKGKLIYTIKEKNTNNIYVAKIFDPNIVEINLSRTLEIVSNLNHLSILQIKGFSPLSFDFKPNPVLVTEFAQNGSLSDILEKIQKKSNNKLISSTKKLIIIYGIASGMRYLHSQDIIHRQLQTSSIFLDDSFYPKISHFNFLKKVTAPPLSNEFDLFVEPTFVAPELWEQKIYSKASDVYSFSMIVYEIVTNKKIQPKTKNLKKFMNEVVNKKIRPEIPKSVPKCYKDLIESCWSQDPQKRPTFSNIILQLILNSEFVENNVDKSEFFKYSSMIESSLNESKSTESENQEDIEKVEKVESDSFKSSSSDSQQKQDKTIEENPKFMIDSTLTMDLSNFEHANKIGHGGFGQIFRITEKTTKDSFVAKISIENFTDDSPESLIQDFCREVNIMTKLNHPSIINIIGFSPLNFNNKPKPTIIMEFASNGSLQDILDLEEHSLSPNGWDDTKKMINIYGIASGMKYLHSLNIIHRDLKPENILEDDYLFPKITDFGLSKNLYQNKSNMDFQSKLAFKGTLAYSAPETVEDCKYSKKSDVYSFGYIIYRLFSINDPFKNMSYLNIMRMKNEGTNPEINFPISSFFENLIEKCWDKDPKKRPSFSRIVHMLRKKEALLENADESEFLEYVDYIDECMQNIKNKKEHKYVSLMELINKKMELVKLSQQQQQSQSQSQKVPPPKKPSIVLPQPPKRFNKIKIDFGGLAKYKEIVVSASIPKIDLEKFDKKEFLGSGGFAKVYKIENKETFDVYAAKILKKENEYLDDVERLSILREVTILPKMQYESIIKFFGYSLVNFKKKEKPVFITELAQNGSLGHVLELEQKGFAVDGWNETKKLINIYGIACGMKYLHSCSIIHRDLKPDNILLDEFLYPKITDFGFSRPYIHDINQISEHDSFVLGTPPFISPEIWDCYDHGCASDVYAFAIIVYEIMTITKPFKNFVNMYQIRNVVKDKNYRPPFVNEIPSCYRKLIESCWSRDRFSRPTFNDIVNELKTNREFITKNIDYDEFVSYTEIVGEKYPEQRMFSPESKPNKVINKVSIPHTKKAITELTISTFKKIIESEEDNDVSTKDCFINLDRFEQKKLLSKTEFSKIFKVVEKETGKEFSARISNIDMNQFSEQEMKNICVEMKKISQINHSCILKFAGFSPTNFKNESKPVVINELIKTKRLKDILIKERKNGIISGWNSTSKLKFIYGVASAMCCLHSNNIVHHNLTPSNILLTRSFNPKLSDFGVCTHLLIMNSITFQSTCQLENSPTYSALEILNSNESTKASDVYSFGLIVYEIFSGEKPFSYLKNFSQLYDEIVLKGKRPKFPAEMPETYKDLIEFCWDQNPNNRPEFIDIVNVIKNDPGFITPDVNKDKFFKFIDKVDKNKDLEHHHHKHRHHQKEKH